METTDRKYRLFSGLLIVIMGIAAGISYGYVYNTLNSGSVEETFENFQNSGGLFSVSIIGWFVVIICDLLVTWCLYKVYEEHNTKLSIWSASFRLIYTVFLVLAVLSLVRIINTNSLNYTILQHHLVMFETTWSWGLIFFGIHLILLGFLNLNSSIISRVIGIYLCIGGFAYTLFHSIIELDILTLNELKTLEAVLITPMATSEIIFALWLIGGSLHVKHHKRTRTEDVA